MLKDFIIIRHLTLFIIPYIFLYGLYIQVNGEVSPGGSFQSGIIFASAVIAFDLVHNKFKLKKYFFIESLIALATIGVLIYATTGMISILFNDNYLNYSSLLNNKLAAQRLGIFVIELGVGLCVASITCLIYIVMNKVED
ncbi:MAG: Na(+)/H(+) antiporter subunit B [Candidatus Rickettsia vulgarisii]